MVIKYLANTITYKHLYEKLPADKRENSGRTKIVYIT